MPQLQVTCPWPTRGILVGLARGAALFPFPVWLACPILLPIVKLRGDDKKPAVLPTGLGRPGWAVCCWATNCRAAAAAMATGGKRPGRPGKPEGRFRGNADEKSLGRLVGQGNPVGFEIGGLTGAGAEIVT